MSSIKRYAIWQVINGTTYFNHVFKTTYEGYQALKRLLYLPSRDETIEGEFWIVKTLILRDRNTGRYTAFRNLVLNPDTTKKDIAELANYIYNGVKATDIIRKFIYRKYFENPIKKGRRFEEYVSQHFEKLGYKVIKFFTRDVKDEGIDLICYKGDELLLIQCKNWTKGSITHRVIKEFIANTVLFLAKRPNLERKFRIKRYLISSRYNLDASGFLFLKENPQWVKFKVLKLPTEKEREEENS